MRVDRTADQPLTLDEAKALLREAARGAGPRAWVRTHPGRAVAFAFFMGWLTARRPQSAERVLAALAERMLALRPRD